MPKQSEARRPTGPAVESLSRGLQILALLAKGSSYGFTQLQRESGLSKAALARILQTLEYEGWISKRIVDGQYRLSWHWPSHNAMAVAQGQLAGLAAESLRQLRRETVWPSDIAVCDGTKMVLLESNRGSGPSAINSQVMGMPPPSMLWSAVGRAYLAACPVAERGRILKNLLVSDHPDDMQANNSAWVKQILAETRKQGYGVRHPGYASPDEFFPGQLSAIAVPITVHGRPVGCLSLVWTLSVASTERIVGTYLSLMRKTADTIGVEFAKHGFSDPLWLDPRYS